MLSVKQYTLLGVSDLTPHLANVGLLVIAQHGAVANLELREPHHEPSVEQQAKAAGSVQPFSLEKATKSEKQAKCPDLGFSARRQADTSDGSPKKGETVNQVQMGRSITMRPSPVHRALSKSA